jgi:hypothetical protein
MKIKNYSNVTTKEKNMLLREAMISFKRFYPDKTGRYSSPSKVRGNVISYHGLNATFAHKFIVDSKTNEIKRIDVSREDYGKNRGLDVYGTLTNDFGFSEYIEDYQVKVSEKFKELVEKFSKFKKSYLKYQQEAQEKKKQITIKVVDKTGVLSKDILDEFLKNTTLEVVSTPAVKLFLSNKKANSFFIKSLVKYDMLGRYKVVYKKTSYKEIYNKFPNNLVYEIQKVYFNYLPQQFYATNGNIEVEIINTPFDFSSIKLIKIQNNTKQFIEIDTIAGYYGEDVLDNIVTKIKISPTSYKIIKYDISNIYKINDFPKKKLLLVKNKNQKVSYGISVAYKMINQNIIKNLYKVNKYEIKDFK